MPAIGLLFSQPDKAGTKKVHENFFVILFKILSLRDYLDSTRKCNLTVLVKRQAALAS